MPSAIIGALRIVLGMDSAAFEKGASDAERKLAAFGKKMQNVGAGLTSVGNRLSTFVTVPLLGIGAASLKAAKESEEAAASVRQALESMGEGAGFSFEQLDKMASKLQGLTTFDDDDILSGVTANLVKFGKVQGAVFERAQRVILDFSQRTGTDLASATQKIGRALEDPIKGLNALSKAGVVFNAEQKKQIEGWVKSGEVAKAQGFILDELAKKYGGQAEAIAKTNPGKITQAWNALGDSMEAVGAAILPVLAGLSVHVKSVAEAFTSLSPETQKWIVIAGGIVAVVGPALTALGLMVTALGALAPILPAIAAGFTAMLGPLGLVTAAVAAAIVAWHNWDSVKTSFPSVAAGIEAGIEV
ncbi:MAG: phage tail length tape measure family protein, partial [Cetobacterium sp.]